MNHPEKSTLIVKTNKFLFSLNDDEMKELKNVMTILGKDSMLTEIALCMGIPGEDIISEPSKVQCSYFTTCDIDINIKNAMPGINDGLEKDIKKSIRILPSKDMEGFFVSKFIKK